MIARSSKGAGDADVRIEDFDADMQAYIRKVDGLYPPDAVSLPISGQRKVYDDLCRAFSPDHPKGVTARDGTIKGRGGLVPVRRYSRAGGEGSATVVYYHGGGFVLGGLFSHDGVCAEICGATGFPVVSVDYRLAPEHVHPAHFDDALSGFRAIAREGRPVVLAGDSAGGSLAAAVALAARADRPKPVGQVLIYPGLGGDALALRSYTEHAKAIHLATADVHYYRRVRAGETDVSGDATFAPLEAKDFRGVAPCVAISADVDPLRDDSGEYVRRLKAAGVPARWINEKGLVHGYLRARHMTRRGRESFARILDAIGRLGRGEGVG
jgi:acetyl esterase